jgi:hypothetical protein
MVASGTGSRVCHTTEVTFRQVQMRTPEPTYDERRANQRPCACGRLVTRPDLCVREGCCLMARHPASGVAFALYSAGMPIGQRTDESEP